MMNLNSGVSAVWINAATGQVRRYHLYWCCHPPVELEMLHYVIHQTPISSVFESDITAISVSPIDADAMRSF
jgi:hypothetical protein